MGHTFTFCHQGRTKNAELVEENEKQLCSKNLIIHGVEESSSDNKDYAIKSYDIYVRFRLDAKFLPCQI